MHCASTASDIFSLWHCSLLTHIISYLYQCRKLPSLPPLFFFFQIPPADGLSVRLFDAQSAAFHRIIHLAPRLLHMPDSLLGGVSVPVCSAARHQCDLRCQRLQKPGGIGIARSVMRRLIKIDFLHVSSRFCLLQPGQNLLFLRRSDISGKDTGKVILLIKKHQRLLVFVHRLTPKRGLRFTGMQCRKRCLSKMPDAAG